MTHLKHMYPDTAPSLPYLLLSCILCKFLLAPASIPSGTGDNPKYNNSVATPSRQRGLRTDVGKEAMFSPGFQPWMEVGLVHIQSSGLECQTQHNSTSETQGLSRQLTKSFPFLHGKAGREKLPRANLKLFSHYLHIVPIPTSFQEKLQCKNLNALYNCTVCKMSPKEIKLSS